MGLCKIVLALLVLFEVLLVHAMGEKSDQVKPSEIIKVRSEGVPGWVVPREADEPAATPAESTSEAPEIRRLGKHHSSDKSEMAGGGVIIGGLVTAIFAAVFAYIRVTRKRDVHGVKY